MKTTKIVIIITLVALNVGVISTVATFTQNSKAISASLATIPDDVVYINSSYTGYPDSTKFISSSADFPTVKDNYSKLNEIKALDGVKSAEFVDILPSGIAPLKNKIVNHNTQPTLKTNMQNIRSDQFKQLDLISGEIPTRSNQIVVSSAVVNHYNFEPNQIIGKSFNNYQVVGVYDDAQSYSQYNSHGIPVIANFAYALTTDHDEHSQSMFFIDDNGVEHQSQYIKITFDNNNTAENIKQLEDQLVIRDSISNLTADNLSNFVPLMMINPGALIAIFLIDIICLFVAFKY